MLQKVRDAKNPTPPPLTQDELQAIYTSFCNKMWSFFYNRLYIPDGLAKTSKQQIRPLFEQLLNRTLVGTALASIEDYTASYSNFLSNLKAIHPSLKPFYTRCQLADHDVFDKFDLVCLYFFNRLFNFETF